MHFYRCKCPAHSQNYSQHGGILTKAQGNAQLNSLRRAAALAREGDTGGDTEYAFEVGVRAFPCKKKQFQKIALN